MLDNDKVGPGVSYLWIVGLITCIFNPSDFQGFLRWLVKLSSSAVLIVSAISLCIIFKYILFILICRFNQSCPFELMELWGVNVHYFLIILSQAIGLSVISYSFMVESLNVNMDIWFSSWFSRHFLVKYLSIHVFSSPLGYDVNFFCFNSFHLLQCVCVSGIICWHH